MSQTIHELYLKYIDAVSSLEDDRYFRYLFELVQSSDNILQQNRQVLHKVVDETWLTVIEDHCVGRNEPGAHRVLFCRNAVGA